MVVVVMTLVLAPVYRLRRRAVAAGAGACGCEMVAIDTSGLSCAPDARGKEPLTGLRWP